MLRHSILFALVAAVATAQTPNTPVPRPNTLPPTGATAPQPAGTPATEDDQVNPTAPTAPAAAQPTAPGTVQPGTVTPGVAQPGTPTPPKTSVPLPKAIVPLPAASPTPGRTRTSTPLGAAGTFDPNDVNLEYPGSDVSIVLDDYARYTGKRIITGNQPLGTISISARHVPVTEAVKIIELSLAMNQIFIEPTEDEHFVKVTSPGVNPKANYVPFIDNEVALANLPVNEQVVMYMAHLKWGDPTETAQTITQGLLSGNPYSMAIPLPKSSSVLLTENAAQIRTILRFLKVADVEPADVVSKFITLQRAQAEDVVTNLEKLFEKNEQQLTNTATIPVQPNGRFGTRVFNPNNPQNPQNPGANIGGSGPNGGETAIEITGGNGFGPTEDNIIVGKVKIAADKRTNRVHIVSRPINMKFIENLVTEYDAEVPLPPPSVRALKYRDCSEVLDALVQAVQDPGDRQTGAAAGANPSALGGNTRPGTNNAATQGNANRFGNTGSNFSANGSSTGTGELSEGLTTTEKQTTPLSAQVGKSTIIADPYTNEIIVVGTSDVKQKVMTLLDSLDTRQPMVMVQVLVGELKLTRNESWGIDYILKNGPALNNTNNPITGTGGTTTTSNGLVSYDGSGQSLINLNGVLNQSAVNKIATLGPNGWQAMFTSESFNVISNFLESSDRFRVITKPQVFTTNNKRAIITSGEEVPVPTQTQSSLAQTGNTVVSNSSIQFKPIELRLEVLPLINSDREVSLEIVQNISERDGTTTIDGNDIPNISQRAVKTYVTIPNKGTLVLGGLIKESQDHTKNGLPYLSRLPVIGWAFGKTVKDKTRSELIVVLRPVVTMQSSENNQLREKVMEDFEIPPDFSEALAPANVRGAVRPKVIEMGPVVEPRQTPPVLRTDAPVSRRRSPQ